VAINAQSAGAQGVTAREFDLADATGKVSARIARWNFGSYSGLTLNVPVVSNCYR
jgi:hypothetical protein